MIRPEQTRPGDATPGPAASPSQDQVTVWRRQEEALYGAALSHPNLYMAAMRLARAVADAMRPFETLEDLGEHFRNNDASYVVPIAQGLDIPQLAMLDFSQVLGAACHLRAREILEETARREALERLAEAGRSGQSWVTLREVEKERNGQTTFEKLEVHRSTGLGFFLASAIDMEKGWVFYLEPLAIDIETGHRLPDAQLPAESQELASKEALMTAAEDLRQRIAQLAAGEVP
ncbi:MAG: hypothetical protein K0U98_15370 [Deltaproteobacteria bacterium]|nr:hypothetical protein [Deltaproteobacteria bacterium]